MPVGVLADALSRGDFVVLVATVHHPRAERLCAVALLVDAFPPNTERS